VLAGSTDALSWLPPRLARAGVAVHRVEPFTVKGIPAPRWLRAVPTPVDTDVAVVTSVHGVRHGIVPWRASAQGGGRPVEYWAAGPTTGRAVREAVGRSARIPRGEGADALARALGRGGGRRLVYFRSRQAGPALTARLRAAGWRASEAVVYTLGPAREVGSADRGALRRTRALVATSPSALSGLRRMMSPSEVNALRARAQLVVLGERTLRAGRGHGFRAALVLPVAPEQRFTQRLLGVVRHASA
jgi:uroporphyrinogen-III synthase